VEFFSKRSIIYTKWTWCAQTFPPIFGLFAIFDRNFANIVTPVSEKKENCVAHLKGLSLLKKRNWKPHQNLSISRDAMIVRTMHPIERTVRRIGAWQKNKHHIFAPQAGTLCSISPKVTTVFRSSS